jgi:hypothetical protein
LSVRVAGTGPGRSDWPDQELDHQILVACPITTQSAPHATRSHAPTSANPAPPANAPPWRCCSPPAVPLWTPPRSRNANSTHSSPAPEDLRGHTTAARLRGHPSWDIETITTATVLRTLAHRCQALTTEAADHQHQILAIIRSWRPDLLEHTGIGPIVAATVLCAWSHPGRIRHDAAFAKLAGVCPIAASSGQTVRYRLNATATANSTARYTPSDRPPRGGPRHRCGLQIMATQWPDVHASGVGPRCGSR